MNEKSLIIVVEADSLAFPHSAVCIPKDRSRMRERWSGSAAQSISKYEANSDCCPFSSKSIEGFSSLAAMWLGTMSSSSPIP